MSLETARSTRGTSNSNSRPRSRTSASHIQDYGPVEERREDFADTTAQFLTMGQDLDATPLFKGLPDDKCSCPHWGYVFKGRLTFDCGDHEEIFEAGDAFYIEAGHVPTSSEPGTEYLQFSPTEQLQIVSDTMMRNMQEIQQGDPATAQTRAAFGAGKSHATARGGGPVFGSVP